MSDIAALEQLMGRLPDRVYVGSAREPIVYAWVRDGRLLYVGSSLKGVGRVQEKSHEMLKHARSEDLIMIWFTDNPRELEAVLIDELKPPMNIQKTRGGASERLKARTRLLRGEPR